MGEHTFKIPRVMIAAPHGKSGKTVLVVGILRALKNRGVDVQPFKKGPDYIDPGWHTAAAGRESRNLDCCFMDAPTIRTVIHDASKGAHVGLIEGAMGLFDGLDIEGTSSSAEVAKQTRTPVILVVDVTRTTRTVAALVMGCMHFDPDVRIAGVILNRVHGKRHETLMRQAIDKYCGIPVVGAIPENGNLALPDRHLGLVCSAESDSCEPFVEGAAAVIEEHVDLDLLMQIAEEASEIDYRPAGRFRLVDPFALDRPPVKIAVARDRVFSFYYPENLQALEAAGAKLIYVDSLADAALPDDVDGLYIGGGFPELFAEQLQANESFRTSVKAHIQQGMATYAECGGLMYLARSIQTEGTAYSMVGAFGMDAVMETKRQGHGYSVVVARENHPWLLPGTVLKGHEHHHSRMINIDEACEFTLENRRGHGIAHSLDGVCTKRTVAGYTHVNALSSPQWATSFVSAARAYREERTPEERIPEEPKRFRAYTSQHHALKEGIAL